MPKLPDLEAGGDIGLQPLETQSLSIGAHAAVALAQVTASPTLSPADSPILSPADEPVRSEAHQCVFLCLSERRHEMFAVQVSCHRPTSRIQEVIWADGSHQDRKRSNLNSNKPDYRDDDATIYRQLAEMCFERKGKWKRWLPLYGVVDVREVNFEFTGERGSDGKMLIYDAVPVNIDETQQRIDRIIAFQPSAAEDPDGDFRCWGEQHTGECEGMMHQGNWKCIAEQIKEARRVERNLPKLHLLKDCARDPLKANRLDTLSNGFAQDTCIYDKWSVKLPEKNKRYKEPECIRGLQYVLGWQLDRMADILPLGFAWYMFAFGLVWSGVIIWAGSRNDWDSAMSFGQLIAGSLALLFVYTRD